MRLISAADIEKDGWEPIALVLAKESGVAVTRDGKVEAVILTKGEYARLLDDQRKSEGLLTLRARFDAELASQNEPSAGERLDSVMSKPARLGGKVKAGETF